MGEASGALRDKAADAAADTFDQVKTAAMSAAESAAEKISEAGFGEGVSRFTENAAETLKTVTDDAITTAFEPSQSHR